MSTDIINDEAILAEVRAQVRALLPTELERVLNKRDAAADNEFVDYEEAAKIIGMSVSWLQKARGAKSPKRHKFGGAVRFRRSDLIAWANKSAEARR